MSANSLLVVPRLLLLINATRLCYHFSMTDEMPFSISPRPGEGAFGNVILVLHKPTGRAFALKCQGKQAIVANELQVIDSITENYDESVRVLYTLQHVRPISSPRRDSLKLQVQGQ